LDLPNIIVNRDQYAFRFGGVLAICDLAIDWLAIKTRSGDSNWELLTGIGTGSWEVGAGSLELGAD